MFNDFISLFFPNYCVGCATSLVKGEQLMCISCQHQIAKTNSHLERPNYIEAKFYGKVNISYALAYYRFIRKGRIQSVLHELKYRNNPEIGEFIGKLYGQVLVESKVTLDADMIIPVPLHKTKLRRRGYNQSLFFANGMSQIMNIPCQPELLLRKVKTETQTKKSRFERWQNVESIFEVTDKTKVCNKDVMLVDDVITTGSTLESCAQELLSSGAKSVGIAAIAAAM